MFSRRTMWIAVVGLVAGFLFNLHFFTMCIAQAMLLALGLREGFRALLGATLLGILAAGTFFQSGGALDFGFFACMPALIFVHGALLNRREAGIRTWWPASAALADVTLYFAVVLVVSSMAAGGEGGLKSLLDQSPDVDLGGPEVSYGISALFHRWAFVRVSLALWTLVGTFYGLAVFANSLLRARGEALRGSLALIPGNLPWVIPALLALTLLMAAAGEGDASFEGEALACLLMLPYFLSGLASLHLVSHAWRARKLWLLLSYMSLIYLAFPALFLIGWGVYTQAREMLDKRDGMG